MLPFWHCPVFSFSSHSASCQDILLFIHPISGYSILLPHVQAICCILFGFSDYCQPFNIFPVPEISEQSALPDLGICLNKRLWLSLNEPAIAWCLGSITANECLELWPLFDEVMVEFIMDTGGLGLRLDSTFHILGHSGQTLSSYFPYLWNDSWRKRIPKDTSKSEVPWFLYTFVWGSPAFKDSWAPCETHQFGWTELTSCAWSLSKTWSLNNHLFQMAFYFVLLCLESHQINSTNISYIFAKGRITLRMRWEIGTQVSSSLMEMKALKLPPGNHSKAARALRCPCPCSASCRPTTWDFMRLYMYIFPLLTGEENKINLELRKDHKDQGP